MKLQFSLRLLLILFLLSALAASYWAVARQRQVEIDTAIRILHDVPDDTNHFYPPAASLARVVNYLIQMNHDDAKVALGKYAESSPYRDNLQTVSHLLLDPDYHQPPSLSSLTVVDGLVFHQRFRTNEGSVTQSQTWKEMPNIKIFESTIKNARFRQSTIEIPQNPVPTLKGALETMNQYDGEFMLEDFFLSEQIDFDFDKYPHFEAIKNKVFSLRIRLNLESYRYQIVN